MAPTRHRGELEAEIMDVLWSSPTPLTAKDIQSRFQSQVPAITTIITVLDRMRIKGIVAREATGGRSHVFSASHSREDRVAHIMSEALASADDQTAALMLFAGSLSEQDREFLGRALGTATKK